jgi:hypothetical protein
MRSIGLTLPVRVVVLVLLLVASLAALVGSADTPAMAQTDDSSFVYEPAIDPTRDPLTGEPWYETETPSRELQGYSSATAPATTPATGSSSVIASATANATASTVESENLSAAGGGTDTGGSVGALLFALGAGVLLVAGGGFLVRRS